MTAVTAVSSSTTNLTTGAPAATGGVTTMNFGDFLDMINPLEHIPIVSSIYRAVTGETINPISRIAGDTMYGGIFGLASAGLAAIGAVGDEVVAANNGGKGISDTVVAALFGDDAAKAGDAPDTQLADAASTSTQVQAGLLQTPATQSPILQIPDLSTPATQVASTATTDTSPDTIPLAAAPAKGLPLDRSKMAYGGVMDTAMMQSAQQNQTLALALAGGTQGLQAQQAIRNSRFAVGAASPASTPTVPLPTTQNPSATAAAIATQSVPSPATPAKAPVLSPADLQNLMQQLQAMKGLNQYRNAAQSLPVPGAMLNSAN